MKAQIKIDELCTLSTCQAETLLAYIKELEEKGNLAPRSATDFMKDMYGSQNEFSDEDKYLTWLGVAELARQYFTAPPTPPPLLAGEWDLVNPEAVQTLLAYIKELEEPRPCAWIPCEQKLPQIGIMVIVRGGIARRMEREWITETGDAAGRPIMWPITHWMPFPNPPLDKTEESK
jgi:Protein of unknown function (DUF551)